jgi:hypothetical protein
MSNEIMEAIQRHRQDSMMHMQSQFINKGEEQEEVEKAEQDEFESLLEKGEIEVILNDEGEMEKAIFSDTELNREMNRVGQEFEKSDIMQAMSYENPFTIQKTGKEIKEQCQNVILPELNSVLSIKKTEADNILQECGIAPKQSAPEYWCGGIKMDVGYRIYDWEETYFPENNGNVMQSLSAPNAEEQRQRMNIPETKEQAIKRREYNEIVHAICEVMTDIKACEILSTIPDDKKYELSPKQILALKFA